MRAEATERLATEILVIGSGAGGSTVAATFAEAGRSVLVLEEGPDLDTSKLTTHSPEAMLTLYRNAGLTPILGRQSIAFVEGCCVGGSTEINSAFWHRLPPGAALRWARDYGVEDLGADSLEAIFCELEDALSVARSESGALPASSRVFKQGLEKIGAPAAETPRAQSGNLTASQFAAGAKRSMSRTYLPRARGAGAQLLAGCRVEQLRHENGRVRHALAIQQTPEGPRRLEIAAETVFVCGGATQSPVLLRRSGIRHRVGDSLRIQPMLKLAAEFDEVLDAHESVMPFYQMRDTQSGVFLGGSVFTPGFLGVTLADRWPENEVGLAAWRRMALYYAACRGSGRGSVRVVPRTGEALVRYALSRDDRDNLRAGLLRLCEALFAAGAVRIYPGLRDWAPFESIETARERLSRPIPLSEMSLSTVHVTSSCPLGSDPQRSATDSWGRVRGIENLHVADASVLPDAPGVNPQGTIMALALRAARRLLAEE